MEKRIKKAKQLHAIAITYKDGILYYTNVYLYSNVCTADAFRKLLSNTGSVSPDTYARESIKYKDLALRHITYTNPNNRDDTHISVKLDTTLGRPLTSLYRLNLSHMDAQNL